MIKETNERITITLSKEQFKKIDLLIEKFEKDFYLKLNRNQIISMLIEKELKTNNIELKPKNKKELKTNDNKIPDYFSFKKDIKNIEILENNLKELKNKNNWTTKDLSENLNIDYYSMIKILSKRNIPINVNKVKEIENNLNNYLERNNPKQ